MYADAGFDDILYGFPFIPSHLERVAKLTSRLEMFHTMVTSREMCQYLANNNPPEGKSWSVFLKVDIALSLSLPFLISVICIRLTVVMGEQEFSGIAKKL